MKIQMQEKITIVDELNPIKMKKLELINNNNNIISIIYKVFYLC